MANDRHVTARHLDSFLSFARTFGVGFRVTSRANVVDLQRSEIAGDGFLEHRHDCRAFGLFAIFTNTFFAFRNVEALAADEMKLSMRLGTITRHARVVR